MRERYTCNKSEIKEAWELSAVDNMQRIKEKTDIEKLERLERLEKVKDRKPNC